MNQHIDAIVALSAILFSMGVLGVLTRKNAITIFMSVELMLNSVNLALVAFSRLHNDITGQMLVIFVMAIAAAEVAVGLAIVISIFRNRQTADVTEINLLRW
ncbi:MAG: NADH-quinone oxidoreductase subunit NuoK [Bacteroidetes bacterium]|nr:NADH-quinone oxidoreductase subunit NuoK [Bacteroidota bacterium]MCA0447198.1 NADH-quinone oxidoreductase subunit NuoK [Bacteroidota bacterium]